VSPVTTRALDPILRRVSRTIFLTLRIAPSATRRPLGLAYLFCRAADTIADTRLLPPPSRIARLDAYRARFERESAGGADADLEDLAMELGPAQAIAEERELLARLPECFREYAGLEDGDRARIRTLVTTLVQGMEMDLAIFPPEESGRATALESEADLDRYTYHVAGCVGEFFTDLHAAHVRALASWDLAAMRERAVLFGKALQMTNILRDVDRDLAIGRSYFPRPRLESAGVTADELRSGRGREKLRPILHAYLRRTLGFYRAGWEYTLAIPRREARLRMACAWPLLIGLDTLALLASARDPYAPGTRIKVSRPEVRRILFRSAARIWSDRALSRIYGELEAKVEAALAGHLTDSSSPRR